MNGKSAEQQARDILEQLEVDGAQAFSAGELVELADVIAEANAYRRIREALARCITVEIVEALRMQAQLNPHTFSCRYTPTTTTLPIVSGVLDVKMLAGQVANRLPSHLMGWRDHGAT